MKQKHFQFQFVSSQKGRRLSTTNGDGTNDCYTRQKKKREEEEEEEEEEHRDPPFPPPRHALLTHAFRAFLWPVFSDASVVVVYVKVETKGPKSSSLLSELSVLRRPTGPVVRTRRRGAHEIVVGNLGRIVRIHRSRRRGKLRPHVPAIHERHATEQSESESGDETESSDGNERWWRRRTILDDGRRRKDARVRAEGVRRDAAFREGREDDKGRVNSEKKEKCRLRRFSNASSDAS